MTSRDARFEKIFGALSAKEHVKVLLTALEDGQSEGIPWKTLPKDQLEVLQQNFLVIGQLNIGLGMFLMAFEESVEQVRLRLLSLSILSSWGLAATEHLVMANRVGEPAQQRVILSAPVLLALSLLDPSDEDDSPDPRSPMDALSVALRKNLRTTIQALSARAAAAERVLDEIARASDGLDLVSPGFRGLLGKVVSDLMELRDEAGVFVGDIELSEPSDDVRAHVAGLIAPMLNHL